MSSRFSNPFVQFFDGNSDTLPGAKLEFFAPGTTTQQDTFSDNALTISNTNPVIADSDGRMGPIYLDDITYKVVLSTAADVVIATADPIGDLVEGQFELWNNDITYNIPDIVAGSDDRFYRSLTDANSGNDPTTSATNWEEIEFERIFNVNVTYALGDRTIASDGMEYFSLIAANLNNNPVTDATSTNWRATDQLRSVDAGGTVDVITATYIPAVGALKDELILRLRASGANATTTPTFAPNGLTAKTIVKEGNQALVASDIAAADHELLLVYNSSNDNWELLNPANNAADTDLSNLTTTGTDKIATAWVNFDGSGTVAIRDDFNVTSITDNGTGDYTVNFTTTLADANYAILGTSRREGGAGSSSVICVSLTTAPTTSAVRVEAHNQNGVLEDSVICSVTIFGGN